MFQLPLDNHYITLCMLEFMSRYEAGVNICLCPQSAAWVSEEDLESGALAVKNNEPLNMLRYVLEGNPVLPMTMINST